MVSQGIKTQLIEARDEYISLIKAELIGPGSESNIPDAEHELISSNPLSRYSIGILYPQSNLVNLDNDETEIKEDAVNSEDDEPVVDKSDDADSSDVEMPKSKSNKNYEFDETATENLDEEIGLSAQYMPSSMGITFLVRGSTKTVRGHFSFATYRSATIRDCVVPTELPDDYENCGIPYPLSNFMQYDKENHLFRLSRAIKKKEVREYFEHCESEDAYAIFKQPAYRLSELCFNASVRVPHNDIEFELNFCDSDYINKKIEVQKEPCSDERGEDDREMIPVRVTALRTHITDDVWSLTVMLVNDYEESPPKFYHCFFQPSIHIHSEINDFIFVETTAETDADGLDDEERSLELLYREKKIYATGLGVSVDWNIDKNGKGTLYSDYFPVAEVPPMNFDLPLNNDITNKQLSMKYLSDLDDSDKSKKLSDLSVLVDLYKKWVGDLETISGRLDPRYHSAAAKNISECKQAYGRMYAGLSTLKKDNKAYSAFELANRAMFMQRVHLRMQQDTSDIDRYPDDKEISKRLQDMVYYQQSDEDCRWRPFQVAFLLMDINSIVNDSTSERDIVDLIWFPTGGGKTEAYLGLTAFTIFYRNLAHPTNASGTAVIMRYTLRLLAAQQFTRAATLICACEYIRQDCESRKPAYPSYPLGKTPITIGLWIGGSHIPNRNTGGDDRNPSASICLSKLKSATGGQLRYTKERFNKFQVLKCPWCGTKLVKDDKDKKLCGQWGYEMRNGKQFYMHCTSEDCAFERRLPVQIIDEELYSEPPTLLFGTVDKFAMLPWDGRIGKFFAVGTDNRSPELIIQDELHLISGALGTIVGLYETAVDAICSQKGVKPKIIASTATIRRAKEQCSVLYNRKVVQFPAPSLDSGDSFFAREAKISYEHGVFGRKYIGLMPSGKTKAMMEIRAMAVLLQRIHMMEMPDEIKDKFWTLTAYFNSLKDLGKASTLVEDDVKDFIIRTANRLFCSRRLIVSADELTSRVTTTELNETLDKLEKLEYSQANIQAKRYASNILLATNMISVGIDVARLNVMLLIGQPKLTSEYIQASSRIGRSNPGVAFVQYDATKSRDRSHYEKFRAYHESFYRFVEPTGATPFSKPARERALHAVVTSILRQRIRLNEDKDALLFDTGKDSISVRDTEDYIIDRISSINAQADNGLDDDIDEVKSEIRSFIEKWQKKARASEAAGKELYFGRRFMFKPPKDGKGRLFKQYNSPSKDSATETLTSMRNVDTQVTGQIIVWEEK